jgi:hypothetical protein
MFKVFIAAGLRALTPFEDFEAFDYAWAKSEKWRIAVYCR